LSFLFSSSVLAFPHTDSVAASSTACTSTNTFRLTLFPTPTTFNYLGPFGSSNYELEDIMWFPLVPHVYPNGQPEANFSVTDWYSSNANYTQWEFNVRPGLMWSNGQSVNATDILTTFGPNYALNASYDVLGLNQQITRSYALNASTAVYVLNTSNPYFATDLSVTDDHVYPATMIQQYGVNSNFFTNPIVDGPWYAQSFTGAASQMVMIQNPHYTPVPAICQIDVNFVETEGGTSSLVQGGSTDLADVTFATANALQSLPNIHLIPQQAAQMQSLQYNDTLYPFNMTQFRQAIVYGINDSAIIQNAFNGFAGEGFTAEGLVPSSLSIYYNQNEKQYSYNPTTAISLLNSIGITKGSDNLLHYSNGTKVTLTLYTDTSKSFDETAASGIVSDLQSLGFTVNQQVVSRSVIAGLPGIAAGVMDLWSSGGVIFPNPLYDALPGWDVYSGVTIPQKYWEYPPSIDSQYQGNLTALETSGNDSQVKSYLDNIQALNAQNLPTIAIAYPDDVWAYSTANWAGWIPYPQGWINVNGAFNPLELAALVPVSQATSSNSHSSSGPTTTTTTTTQTTNSVSSNVGSSSSNTGQQTSTSNTTPTNTGAASSSLVIVAAVVIVVVIIALAVVFLRRRSTTA
jgi:ABC-type transport system substrate-binding protein